ncbi:multidrug effflux MFS transporter [Lichenihabitans psoromatis]|uniref:multidrug effflux MFS transporter n=1 Tax=Lichenihabitans psoromatis TaxID=2528642 RepID=UPI001FDECECA|nr:multidrug effflux MFS transporter [Lichenihabitans psoromatis]
MTVMAAPSTPSDPGMGSRQFIGLVAALMAINALAIDSMLPALPTIAHSLGLSHPNQQQWIVTAYLIGFGSAQIFYGTLADRFGRKPVLLTGISIYVVCSIAAALATSLETMLIARALQGVGSAATRVLAVSIVRDCYSGSQMARVMSFSFIVFLAVPIIAPSLGQLIMLVGPWRWIFGALALFGLTVMLWSTLRLRETLHPNDRIPIEIHRVWAAYRAALTNRTAVGYMLAMTMMLGGLFGFINSAQQVFGEVFQAPRLFTAIFALIALFMALSSLLNARIVGRLGTRRVSHVALLGYIFFAVVHALVAICGLETIWSFTILQAAMMFGFGLVVSNFGSLAMGPLGHLAGTGSSVQGFVTTLGGALLGFYIGQQFDGTVVPITVGFAALGLAALACVAFAEKGRLFARHTIVQENEAVAGH